MTNQGGRFSLKAAFCLHEALVYNLLQYE